MAIAEKVGHAELAFVPYLTMGYSTMGIWCRNIAYASPARTIGVLHMKSGNLEGFVREVVTLIVDEAARRERGAKAVAFVARYSWEAVAERHLKIIMDQKANMDRWLP